MRERDGPRKSVKVKAGLAYSESCLELSNCPLKSLYIRLFKGRAPKMPAISDHCQQTIDCIPDHYSFSILINLVFVNVFNYHSRNNKIDGT